MSATELWSDSAGIEDFGLCRILAIGGLALHHGEFNLLLFRKCDRRVLVPFLKNSSLLLLNSRLRFRHPDRKGPWGKRGGQ